MNSSNNLIILLLIIILIAGAILTFRVVSDLNGQIIEVGKSQNETDVSTEKKDIGVENALTDPLSVLDINKTDLEKFNYNFERYIGTQTGSMTRGLVNTTYNYNISGTQKVSIEYKGKIYSADEDIKNLKGSIGFSDSYTISVEYNPTTQYVEKVIIK